MRIVFDSNIFVSAITLPGGRADQAVARILDGEADLILSRPIILEVLDVLQRKFSRDSEELARVAVFLSSLGSQVMPTETLTVLKDVPDNRILECAIAGDASTIVTGDRAMLALRTFRGITIQTLKDFLADQPRPDA